MTLPPGFEPAADGVAHDRHDDRDRAGRLLRRSSGQASFGDDDFDAALGDLGSESGKARRVAERKPALEHHVAALDVAEIGERFAKDVPLGPRGVAEDADPANGGGARPARSSQRNACRENQSAAKKPPRVARKQTAVSLHFTSAGTCPRRQLAATREELRCPAAVRHDSICLLPVMLEPLRDTVAVTR